MREPEVDEMLSEEFLKRLLNIVDGLLRRENGMLNILNRNVACFPHEK